MSGTVETLAARVIAHGAGRSDHPALQTGGDGPRSYAWLSDAVRRCAASMHALGVGPGARVLIDAQRGEEYVVRLLAGWYLGASVIPVATGLPRQAEAAMLAQLGDTFDVRLLSASQLRAEPLGTAPVKVRGSDEAYVFFTSGSSGSPKGVRIGYGGLPHLFEHQASAFRVSSSARTSWMLAGHFDASISDIGVPLWSGACLAIWSGTDHGGSMLDFVSSSGLTHIDLPPSQLPALVARGLPPTLETIVVGGEPAAPDALRSAARLVRVLNVYGPTETTVCASVEVIDPDRTDDRPSLGRPLPGVGFHVENGELLISGWGVALGYLVEEPGAFGMLSTNGPRAYRTGDLVEALDDGTFQFHGRADRQVQLRGQRVELGEIEQTLCQGAGVRAAAAVAVHFPAPRIVAFVEGNLGAATVAAESLQEWKRPASIRAVDALPRLANDKVDFAALTRKAAREEEATKDTVDPLSLAWCQTLGCAEAQDDQDFFALGGDSVTALELSVEAARAGVALEPEAIFEHPRLGDLRAALTRGVRVEELQRRSDEVFASMDLASAPSPSPSSQKRGVLMTGATGMLGLQLLRSGDLASRPVYALVRGKTAEHGAERLGRLLGAPLPPNVHVLRGDLGLPSLGLDEAAIASLADNVGEVVHAAGAVDLVRSYGSLYDVHVAGTARVMEVAARLGARLHHVSTLSIFVESDLPSGTIDERARLAPNHRVFGGYAQSKWVGDDLAQRYPLGGSVLRLGLLTAESGPEQPMDQLSRVIRGTAEIGAWPTGRDESAFDVTPVRSAARLIARLLESKTTRPSEPVHLACPTSTSGADLRRAMEAEGIALGSVTPWPPPDGPTPRHSADRAVAMAALTARAQGGAPALPRSGDLFLATDFSFDCASVRREHPEALPAASTHESLRALVRVALGSASVGVEPVEVSP